MKKTFTGSGTSHGPEINLKRIGLERNEAGHKGEDGCESVLAQAHQALKMYSDNDVWLREKRPWKVKFLGPGEEGTDAGGVYNESLSVMCDELHDRSLPLFVRSPNNRSGVGEEQNCFVFNPSATSAVSREHFHFVGRLIGYALRTGQCIALELASPMWKLLSG